MEHLHYPSHIGNSLLLDTGNSRNVIFCTSLGIEQNFFISDFIFLYTKLLGKKLCVYKIKLKTIPT